MCLRTVYSYKHNMHTYVSAHVCKHVIIRSIARKPFLGMRHVSGVSVNSTKYDTFWLPTVTHVQEMVTCYITSWICSDGHDSYERTIYAVRKWHKICQDLVMHLSATTQITASRYQEAMHACFWCTCLHGYSCVKHIHIPVPYLHTYVQLDIICDVMRWCADHVLTSRSCAYIWIHVFWRVCTRRVCIHKRCIRCVYTTYALIRNAVYYSNRNVTHASVSAAYVTSTCPNSWFGTWNWWILTPFGTPFGPLFGGVKNGKNGKNGLFGILGARNPRCCLWSFLPCFRFFKNGQKWSKISPFFSR